MNGIQVKLQVKGTDDLIASLNRIGGKRLAVNAQRRAITAAIAPIRETAQATVPKRYGWLKRSISSKIKAYQSGVVVGIVGPRSDLKAVVTTRSGRSMVIKPSKYAHLVEFGAAAHVIKVGNVNVPHPGARGTGFLRRAWEAHASGMLATMERILWEAIENGR